MGYEGVLRIATDSISISHATIEKIGTQFSIVNITPEQCFNSNWGGSTSILIKVISLYRIFQQLIDNEILYVALQQCYYNICSILFWFIR